MFTIDDINAILSKIDQAAITDAEMVTLEGMPMETEEELFAAVAKVLNERGGEGVAIEKLKALAILNNIAITFDKKVFNNVMIGGVL